jgi:dihydroorotase
VSAEVVATKDALMLIEKYQLKGKLCHYSSGEGLRLIREARDRGVNVVIEVTPQHLFYDLDKIQEVDLTSFQMNPPIRPHHDRLALLEALKKGEINYLATDHAPHAPVSPSLRRALPYPTGAFGVLAIDADADQQRDDVEQLKNWTSG